MLYDAHATTCELQAARIEIALIPIGAIEQHSTHLPLGTDWIAVNALAHSIAELLARDREVYLLPTFPFSLSQCHGPMPGTVWLTPKTLANVLHDTVRSLYDQGIRRIAVINGHGGNFVLGPEIRELNRIFPDLIVISAVSRDPSGAKGPTGRVTGGDIHAGAGETASQLYLNKDHVRAKHVDHVPPVGREFLDYAYMGQISPYGVWGRPSEATAEAGERAFQRAAANMADNILRSFEQIQALRGATDR